MSTLMTQATGLSVALGVGLLIGLERERAKRDASTSDQAGLRTFALLALGGAVAALLHPLAVGVAGFFVALLAAVNLSRAAPEDAGLTTEVAMLVAFLLGALAMTAPGLAGGTGVVATMLLANRTRLHRLSRQWLSERELQDLLKLAAAAFVVMPLLPDRTVDPWDAINPRQLWTLAVAIMAIASLGYLSQRALGPRYGLIVAGLAGGFVSSTATVVAMGSRARTDPGTAHLAVAAALISNIGTLVQMAIILVAVSPVLATRAAWPLACAGATAVGVALLAGWRSLLHDGTVATIVDGRPFELGEVLRFVALLGGVALLVAITRRYVGEASLPWVMVVSGIVDVHAAGASLAQAVAAARLDPERAAAGLTVAIAANGALKAALAAQRGGRMFALRVVPGIAAIVVAFAIAAFYPVIARGAA